MKQLYSVMCALIGALVLSNVQAGAGRPVTGILVEEMTGIYGKVNVGEYQNVAETEEIVPVVGAIGGFFLVDVLNPQNYVDTVAVTHSNGETSIPQSSFFVGWTALNWTAAQWDAPGNPFSNIAFEDLFGSEDTGVYIYYYDPDLVDVQLDIVGAGAAVCPDNLLCDNYDNDSFPNFYSGSANFLYDGIFRTEFATFADGMLIDRSYGSVPVPGVALLIGIGLLGLSRFRRS